MIATLVASSEKQLNAPWLPVYAVVRHAEEVAAVYVVPRVAGSPVQAVSAYVALAIAPCDEERSLSASVPGGKNVHVGYLPPDQPSF